MAEEGSETKGRWRRIVFGVAGLIGLGVLVHYVGAARIAEALWSALPWVPVLLCVEGARIAVEAEATRTLYAEVDTAPPRATLMRAQLVAYWVFVVSPMGRAASEVTKATILTKHVGADRAAAVATVAQGTALLGTAIVSVACALAATLRPGAWPLAAAVWAQTAGVAAVAALLLWSIRRETVGKGVGRLLGWMGLDEARRRHFPSVVHALPALPWRAVLGFALSRTLDVLLFVVAIAAVSGGLDPIAGLRAMGVSLLGAAAVDLVPADIGLTEGAFALFHEAVGVSAPHAISLGLLFHATQICWVAVSALASFFWGDEAVEDDAPEPRDPSA